MKERNGQLRYLSIVIGAFLSVGVIVGLTNNLYSLYVIPITTGLGISRGLYSMGITVRYIASAFCNLFMGRLYQRFGYRRPTVLLVLLVAASYVGYGTARNAVPLFLGALIYGVGEYFISTAALSRMLGNWFQSHLGVVTGIVMAASGVGGSALSLVLSGIMESAGWRASLLFAAGLLAAVAVMIFFVMKDRPEELGLQPYHDPERRGAAHKPKKVAAPWAGVPMQVLLKKPYFYLTMIGMMLATIASNGVYSAVVPHLQDRGLSAAYAAKMLSLMLVLLAVDKIVLGMLADRFGAHFSTLLCVLFTFSGIVVLTLVKNEWQAVIAVVLLSVSVCLNGFIQPLLAAEIFGRSAYNTTLGIMMAMLSVGGLLSSPLVNFSFDATGSYTRILIVLAVIAAVDALFLLPAFHAEAKYRRELEASGQLSDAGPETCPPGRTAEAPAARPFCSSRAAAPRDHPAKRADLRIDFAASRPYHTNRGNCLTIPRPNPRIQLKTNRKQFTEDCWYGTESMDHRRKDRKAIPDRGRRDRLRGKDLEMVRRGQSHHAQQDHDGYVRARRRRLVQLHARLHRPHGCRRHQGRRRL